MHVGHGVSNVQELGSLSLATKLSSLALLVQKNQTFKYQVSGIFLWNGGSWDVQVKDLTCSLTHVDRT